MWDCPTCQETQGNGATVVLRERESRLHGEGWQVLTKPYQGGTRDAERQNCMGEKCNTGEPGTPKGVSPVRGGADRKVL